MNFNSLASKSLSLLPPAVDLLPICVAALWRWCCCLPPPCLPVVPLCAAPFRTALPLSRTCTAPCTAPCTALQLQVAVHPGPGLCGLAARGRPAAGWVSVWVLGRRCLGVRAWRPHHHQALPLSAAAAAAAAAARAAGAASGPLKPSPAAAAAAAAPPSRVCCHHLCLLPQGPPPMTCATGWLCRSAPASAPSRT